MPIKNYGDIGIFDSDLRVGDDENITKLLPEYDYLYLADSARAPYGSRSQKQIFDFTLRAVKFLFAKNCRLIILACNTASAKALRRIQRSFLPKNYPDRRVLGVIIPTIETVAKLTKITASALRQRKQRLSQEFLLGSWLKLIQI